MEKIIIAITGASGAIYAQAALNVLAGMQHPPKITLIASKYGEQVFKYELGKKAWDAMLEQVDEHFNNDNMFATCASGSAHYNSMVIVPCSMGTLARVAHGCSDSLILRTADVILKQRRRLVLAVREMPFSVIHLRNMAMAAESGAVICAACPEFYSHPQTIAELADSTARRILQSAVKDINLYQWNGGINPNKTSIPAE